MPCWDCLLFKYHGRQLLNKNRHSSTSFIFGYFVILENKYIWLYRHLHLMCSVKWLCRVSPLINSNLIWCGVAFFLDLVLISLEFSFTTFPVLPAFLSSSFISASSPYCSAFICSFCLCLLSHLFICYYACILSLIFSKIIQSFPNYSLSLSFLKYFTRNDATFPVSCAKV